MKIKKSFFQISFATILLLLNSMDPAGFQQISEILKVLSVGHKIFQSIAKQWRIIDTFVLDFAEPSTYSLTAKEKYLIRELRTNGNMLDEASEELKEVGNLTIVTVLNMLPATAQQEFNNLLNVMAEVDNHYIKMMKISNDDTQSPGRSTLEKLAKSVVPVGNDSNLMDKIYDYIVVNKRENTSAVGIHQLMENSLQEMDIICKAQQSPQQVFYNFFNIIALTQLKYFIVVQLSNTLLRLYRQANDANLMRAEYVRRTNIFIQSTKKSMAKASLDLWMCDPPEHIEDETYLQLTDLVQGYIENEINLNVRKSCSESCSTYSLAKPQDCQKNNTFCSKQRMCGGMFVECMYLDSNMDVCPGDVESKRRLNYVQYEDKRVLGINMVCPVPLMKAKSWFRVIDKHCAYCMCLCVDEVTNNSNKYFSLKTVIANVSDNMIVTGLRFVKENNIIHLQVQEGKLMPYGHINQSTVRWIPVAENALYENSTSDNSTSELDFHAANSTSDNTISVQSTSDNNTNGNSTNDNSDTGKSTNDNSTKDNSTSDNSTNELDIHQENSTNELDFHTLTWESRALDLDVLKADEGHLVTGVRFKVIENHLSFDIYTTPFEFDNGNLIEPHIKSVWKDNANERQLLELPNPDISTNSPSPSIPNNGNDQYIQFSHTDVDKDLAQTIIPFIDLQEVVSTLPVPLSGAGIYYKGTNNFGGFIAPKIITYDYNKHMKDVCNVEPK